MRRLLGSLFAGGDLTGTYPNPTISAQAVRTDKLIHVKDEKSSSSSGGTFTSGAWRTRTLNTVKTNTITGASLTSDQITLPAGTYWADGSAPAYRAAQHRTRLYDTTGAAELVNGTNEFTIESADTASNRSFCRGAFTLTVTSVIEFQHRGNQTQATNGFGTAQGFATEVYADLAIWKVA